jgi:hypothetical protein
MEAAALMLAAAVQSLTTDAGLSDARKANIS